MPSERYARADWIVKRQGAALARELRVAHEAGVETADYVLLSEEEDGAEPHPASAILLSVLLGVGVHASKEALVPSEPALEKIGLGPVAYAVLTVLPVALGIFSPLFWGMVWDRSVRWVLIGAPVGELTGAVLTAFGLHALGHGGGATLVGVALVTGLLLSSACRAGITIAEFSTIGRIRGVGSFLGFSALVLAKHGSGALMSLAVPRVLADRSALAGITFLQCYMLTLHVVALLAGVGLSWLHRNPHDAPYYRALDATPNTHQVCGTRADSPSSGDPSDVDSASPMPLRSGLLAGGAPAKDGARGGGDGASAHTPPDRRPGKKRRGAGGDTPLDVMTRHVLLIGLWRALQVGTLHAYHSVRVELTASLGGLSIVDAGSLLATNDGIAVAALPLLALAARGRGLHLLATITPFLSLLAIVLFVSHSHSASAGGVGAAVARATAGEPSGGGASLSAPAYAELLTMSLLEVGAPVIPLALLPTRRHGAHRTLGSAFGVIETLFIACQICLVMLLGFVRDAAGAAEDFHGAVAVLACGFAAAGAVAATMHLLAPAGDAADAATQSADALRPTPTAPTTPPAKDGAAARLSAEGAWAHSPAWRWMHVWRGSKRPRTAA